MAGMIRAAIHARQAPKKILPMLRGSDLEAAHRRLQVYEVNPSRGRGECAVGPHPCYHREQKLCDKRPPSAD
jgi:hypothetical protein